jgi:hypothetical protein
MNDYSSFLAIIETLAEVKTIDGKRVIIKAAFEIIRALTEEIKFHETRNEIETRVFSKAIESKNIHVRELEEQSRKRHRQDEDAADVGYLCNRVYFRDSAPEHDEMEE